MDEHPINLITHKLFIMFQFKKQMEQSNDHKDEENKKFNIRLINSYIRRHMVKLQRAIDNESSHQLTLLLLMNGWNLLRN